LKCVAIFRSSATLPKYDDHLSLFRQAEILACHGADIPRLTLIDWCAQGVATLRQGNRSNHSKLRGISQPNM